MWITNFYYIPIKIQNNVFSSKMFYISYLLPVAVFSRYYVQHGMGSFPVIYWYKIIDLWLSNIMILITYLFKFLLKLYISCVYLICSVVSTMNSSYYLYMTSIIYKVKLILSLPLQSQFYWPWHKTMATNLIKIIFSWSRVSSPKTINIIQYLNTKKILSK